ncbi:Eco57I restriction-modification methylase domain-containing protein, partial [candidate division KSB1 bacterium]
MNLTTVRSEGSLISADLLEEIYTADAPGQKLSDFGVDGNIRLTDEIAACWSDARAYWEALQRSINRLKDGETGTTPTREQWILPLLRTLGFDKVIFTRSAAQVGGLSYYISHRLESIEDGLPIHIEGVNIDIDRRPHTGRPRISPHALIQEYLNRSEPLWGIVTNGSQFRILRDSERLSRPTYIEFDLKQMMEAELFSEFQLFYRIVHRTRWPKDTESAHECLLEDYYQHGIETGGRVRDRLRDGVEEALKIFGNGFLIHPDNTNLIEGIKEGNLEAPQYYRQLLRMIYRYLFLMVAEERKLVGPDPQNDSLYEIYHAYYSITRFRELVERPVNPEEIYWDLYEGVKQTFILYCDENISNKMGISALNGDLFGPSAMPDLEQARLFNKDFLHGFAQLSLFKDNKTIRRINYAYLDVEELGSVYESLLDYHPILKIDEELISFDLAFGTERKSTGSYYTRPELVNELIKSALVPVIEDRLEQAKTKEEKIQALKSLKVCDPAAGSGHFLLAAARRIARELAKVRTGEEHPTPSEFRSAVRDVIQHCIYGVDLNPLAVDLCKVALWIEGHNRGKPLTFLDHRIRCGNSLIGLDTLDRLKDGIPDDAFKPVTGDDKEVARIVKNHNKIERKNYEKGIVYNLLNLKNELSEDLAGFADKARSLDEITDDDPKNVNYKQELYKKIRTNRSWFKDWTAANIWTAAFFYPLIDTDDPAIPTHDKLLEYLDKPNAVHGQLVGKANAMCAEHKFFHWPLEFPEIIDSGGFDVLLGNPPWELIQPEEQTFFGYLAPEIAKKKGIKRKELIKELKITNPLLSKKWFKYQQEIKFTG